MFQSDFIYLNNLILKES